jgi:integrase
MGGDSDMSKRRGNGEGSITQRPDGIWEGRLTLLDGRRKSFYNKSRQVVARKLAEALRDREKGAAIVTDERLTVAAYLAQWLERMAPPRVRPSTHQRYAQLLAHVTRAYGEQRLTRLTARHLADLYAQLQRPAAEDGAGISATTAHHVHTVLHEALDDAFKLDLIVANPTERVDAPKLRRAPVKPFSSEEAWRLIEAARGERLEALYMLALTSGLRLGELLALTWRQVDLDAGQLRVVASLQRVGANRWQVGEPKTESSRRQIALSSLAIEALRAHRARQLAERLALADVWNDHDLVFCDELGGYLNPNSVTRTHFQGLLARAGLPRKRFHDCRHSAASLLLEMGVPMKVVSVMLGHTTIVVTSDIYSHVTPDMQREAAVAMDALFRRHVS